MKKLFRCRYLVSLIFFGLISWVAISGGSYLWEKWQFKCNYRAAKQGNMRAQHQVGLAYSVGKVVMQNDALAVQWFEKAANQGYPGSQHSLGLRYANGRGVEKDWLQAVQWYLKAAEQNYVNSIVNLGNCYARGNGIKWDKQKALYWYQKGAELGDDMAQHHLADLYLEGHDAKSLEQHSKSLRPRLVIKDEVKARYWFERSAQQGYADSQYKLAKLYLAENGRFGNDAEAVKWLKKAGSNGIAEAYHHLGFMYLEGRGGAKSKTNAIRYFILAVKGGEIDALGPVLNMAFNKDLWPVARP